MDKRDFILPACRDCLDPESNCCHRQRYDRIVHFLKQKRIWVKYVESVDPPMDWRAGYVEDSYIGIWRNALPIFGWDMLASVLIHELGHILCWRAERIPQDPTDSEECLKVEMKANKYGYESAHQELLVPGCYWEYREFFLENHRLGGEKRPEFLLRLENWKEKHSPTRTDM